MASFNEPVLPAEYVATVEALSARLHEIYQAEAHRRGDVRHADAYEDLPDATKEWDRVLARWILTWWVPGFDVRDGFPPAQSDGSMCADPSDIDGSRSGDSDG